MLCYITSRTIESVHIAVAYDGTSMTQGFIDHSTYFLRVNSKVKSHSVLVI